MPKFEVLTEELTKRMEYDNINRTYAKVAFDSNQITRRHHIEKDVANIWRKPFVHDIDKIMHCPFFNRYADKTQVYSLFMNDDITRRNLHVQLVSRISRTIGGALHLNMDLLEAISLGHDIGHPPFAHTGEKFLDELYNEHTGRHFLHNIQSVRVLDKIYPYNISLQTLDGIAAHNGEFELEEYVPVPLSGFDEFDEKMEKCTQSITYANKILPSTLEGAVVRISDIIAYLGKDRQDAILTKQVQEDEFSDEAIGSINAEIINNLVVNIIENSYGKSYIKLDHEHFRSLKQAKKENYEKIYNRAASKANLDLTVKPMMRNIYEKLLKDLENHKTDSPIYKHHIEPVSKSHYKRTVPYELTENNQIVVDYIASMTDNYFIELHKFLFPDIHYPVVYKGYFDDYYSDSDI